MNINTLSPLYPPPLHQSTPNLSATQMIALHLSINRPRVQLPSEDSLFGPYISILPRDFSFHPLSWILNRSSGRTKYWEESLLSNLPRQALYDLEKIAGRFEEDYRAACEYMVGPFFLQGKIQLTSQKSTRQSDASPLILEDFLWGWLNGQ